MQSHKIAAAILWAVALALSGCSRQQSDWQKARETNTTDAYEQFLKHYPSGDFTPQAQARLKELYIERDWEKARDADTPDAYQAFVTQHPEGTRADEARTRLENFALAQTPAGTAPAATPPAGTLPQGGTAPAGAAASTAPSQSTAPSESTASSEPGAPSEARAPASAPAKPPRIASAAASRTGAAPSVAAPHRGRFGVQLGAFKSGASAAERRWARLQKEYPALLKGLSSKVIPKKTASGTLYRLQAVGVSEKGARSICKTLRARAQACVVVRAARA